MEKESIAERNEREKKEAEAIEGKKEDALSGLAIMFSGKFIDKKKKNLFKPVLERHSAKREKH